MRTSLAGAAAGLLAAALAAGMADGQTPTFSSKVEAVRVDVLVTERGRPLRRLQASDFEVRDNGVLQQVDLAVFEQLPLNVVLAFDTSSSVAGERLRHLREAGYALVSGLTPRDRMALVEFSGRVQLGSPFTADTERLRAAIDATAPSGDTSLVDASFVGLVLAESEPGRSLEIIFTDGQDVLSWLRPGRVVETARRSNVVVYAVSVGATSRSEFLRDLTEDSGGRLFELESTRDLTKTFVDILEEFRQRYLVSFTPQGVASTGWHALDVRIKRRGPTVRARPGYFRSK